MTNLGANIPDFSISIIDPGTGSINPAWFNFFLQLFNRTGSETGTNNDQVIALIREIEALISSLAQVDMKYRAFSEIFGQLQLVANQQRQTSIDLGYTPIHGSQSDPALHAPATTSANGFMTASDKAKLDGIGAGAVVTSVTGTAPITSSGGAAPAISISNVTTTTDGSMTASDKVKLNGIASGAQVNVATNIGQGTLTATTIPITSSTGTGTTLPSATPSLAGLLSASDKTRIDALSSASSPTFVSLTLSNGQVSFPAAQVSSSNANTLDDYEEGTFTPSLSFVTPGNLAITYTNRVGVYTKIGNSVVCHIRFTTASFTYTTASGGLIITGLPFASRAAPSDIIQNIGVSYTATIAPGANWSLPGLTLNPASTTLNALLSNLSSGTSTLLTAGNLPTGTNFGIGCGGVYTTDT